MMAALDQLTAISPLDGRYGSKVEALREVFSEYGLVKRRVAVECAWLAALCAHPGIPECPPLAADEAALLARIADGFDVDDARRVKEIETFPASFRMQGYAYDRQNGVVRYGFTQCPNAEFARRHHMEDVLPLMCNCDHMAMQKLHATLIREGTCCTCDRCDYCIVGDQNPIARQYALVTRDNGLWVSVRK